MRMTWQPCRRCCLFAPPPASSFPAAAACARFAYRRKGKGRRGGGRVIYFWVGADDQIFLLYAYAKNERQDITPKQARLLRSLVEE